MLVTVLLMIFFVSSLMDVHEEKSQKEICKQEIRAEAMTNVRGTEIKSFFETGGEQGVKCHTFLEEIETDDEEEIKAELVRFMYDAWDMFHEGELDLFDVGLTDRNFCVLTHHIEFNDNAEDVGEVEGFVEYLAENEIPSPAKEEMSYLEYLHCYNTRYDVEEVKKEIGGSSRTNIADINTENDYGIMFVYTKAGELDSLVKGAGITSAIATVAGVTVTVSTGGLAVFAIGGALAGGAGGLITSGPADWSACVVLFPYTEESINQFDCDYLPGEHPEA